MVSFFCSFQFLFLFQIDAEFKKFKLNPFGAYAGSETTEDFEEENESRPEDNVDFLFSCFLLYILFFCLLDKQTSINICGVCEGTSIHRRNPDLRH
jgi:hypothetical protein